MTDKYGEFKEWWSRKGFTANPFIEFEEECAEKDKKEKFDDIMCHWLNKSMDNPRMFNLNELFDKLKEKDLIK